jgi:hypothetical protein
VACTVRSDSPILSPELPGKLVDRRQELLRTLGGLAEGRELRAGVGRHEAETSPRTRRLTGDVTIHDRLRSTHARRPRERSRDRTGVEGGRSMRRSVWPRWAARREYADDIGLSELRAPRLRSRRHPGPSPAPRTRKLVTTSRSLASSRPAASSEPAGPMPNARRAA